MSENLPQDKPRRTRRQKVFAVLPTLLTLCNAACGFGAITIAARVGPEHVGTGDLILASKLIFLAMLFDVLDGSAARLTNQTSDFGAQLDSLCDAISFGLAPAFILLQLVHPDHRQFDLQPMVAAVASEQSGGSVVNRSTIYEQTPVNGEADGTGSIANHPSALPLGEVSSSGALTPSNVFPLGQNSLAAIRAKLAVFHPRILWAITVLFMVCAILRLARFNVETDEEDSHEYFSGLPSPAAAGVVASFPIGLRELNEQLPSSILDYLLPALALLLPIITLAAAVLMVSRIRYAHVFNQMIRGRRSRTQILQIVFAGVLVFVVNELALPVLFCAFAFSSPIRAIWQRYLRRKKVAVAAQNTPSAA
ncbi:MAG: CDP-alcohol phosphatidyltransferase family protein [Planctomycetota bacterium]